MSTRRNQPRIGIKVLHDLGYDACLGMSKERACIDPIIVEKACRCLITGDES